MRSKTQITIKTPNKMKSSAKDSLIMWMMLLAIIASLFFIWGGFFGILFIKVFATIGVGIFFYSIAVLIERK